MGSLRDAVPHDGGVERRRVFNESIHGERISIRIEIGAGGGHRCDDDACGIGRLPGWWRRWVRSLQEFGGAIMTRREERDERHQSDRAPAQRVRAANVGHEWLPLGVLKGRTIESSPW